MARSATVTKTKTATKAANDKTSSKPRATKPKADTADKPKREPTAYQLFCKANMKTWNEANPGRAKEAMAQMAKLWKDAPENPNRGSDPKARKPKPAAKSKAKPAAAKSKKKNAEADEEEEEEEQAKSSDHADGEDSED